MLLMIEMTGLGALRGYLHLARRINTVYLMRSVHMAHDHSWVVCEERTNRFFSVEDVPAGSYSSCSYIDLTSERYSLFL